MSDDGKEFTGEVDAIIWSMKVLDFILGLPDIVRNYITLFFTMLQDCHDELVDKIRSVRNDPERVRRCRNIV